MLDNNLLNIKPLLLSMLIFKIHLLKKMRQVVICMAKRWACTTTKRR